MPTFVVAALNQILPIPPSGPVSLKIIRQMYIAEAANDQAAIDLVAAWDTESGADYLAIPFNPKKATGG